MIRRCLLALGSCGLLAACGAKFSAADAAGGSGGTSGTLGGAGASEAGNGAGDSSGARGGDELAGEAGTDSGGAPAAGGSTTNNGGAGAGGGPLTGHGGSSGNAGAGGGVQQPNIPQLGLALWLRADLGVQQQSGLVQAWLDQSGNQMNALPTGANVRPEYDAKGLNGMPTLKFDGAGQFLKLPDGFGDFSHGLAGFMVLQPGASDCASVVELSNGSEIEDIALGMWQNKWTYEVFDLYMQSGNVDLLAPSLYATNHRPDVGMLNASADLRINGALLQSMDMPVPALNARENNFVGHTLYKDCNYFEGMISEIILYQRVVTANEVKSIETYLEQHWDLGPAVAP